MLCQSSTFDLHQSFSESKPWFSPMRPTLTLSTHRHLWSSVYWRVSECLHALCRDSTVRCWCKTWWHWSSHSGDHGVSWDWAWWQNLPGLLLDIDCLRHSGSSSCLSSSSSWSAPYCRVWHDLSVGISVALLQGTLGCCYTYRLAWSDAVARCGILLCVCVFHN